MKSKSAVAKSETVFKVFLFTDIVGSTDLKRRVGNEISARIISKHDELFRECLSEFGGIENDHAGDGFFATFDRPSGAVHCALAFQQRLDQLDISEKIKVRTGIHMGEIVRLSEGGTGEGQDKLIGIAIDTAARVMGLCIGGQLLLTRIAFDIAREQVLTAADGKPIEWRAHGPYTFKGIDTPIDVYEAGIVGFSPLAPPPDSEKVKRAVTMGDELTLGWRPAKAHPIPNRANWELVEKLGEGSFGEVWLATHKKVKDRHVFKFCFQPDRLRGLKREVILFRLLQESLGHREDIAQIIDWQFEEPPYFLECEYTEGGDLGAWCRQQGGVVNVPMETRLDLMAQLCEALAAAHSVGVLHKDIKPSNVLIFKNANTGRPQIRLTDFGIGLVTDRQVLAQRGITATGLTMTGLTASTASDAVSDSSTAGTSLYVAPEILEGKPATTQSDIYSLGIILYQLAIGDLRAALAPGWERDLPDEFLREDIAACVDGKPSRRLASAADLAQRLRTLDLRRLERQAQRREAEAAERAVVMAEKNKGRRMAALVVLFGAAALVAYFSSHIATERARADQDKRRREEIARAVADAEEKSREYQYELYIANVQFAASCVKEGRFQLAEASLQKTPEAIREWDWGFVLRRVHPELYYLNSHSAALTDACFSADGGKVALASQDKTATVWNAETGAKIAQLEGHTQKINFIRFSPDGARLLTGSDDKTAKLWETGTGRLMATLNGHSEVVIDGEFSPDGTMIVTASADLHAMIWDVASGRRDQDLAGHADPLTAARFGPDGQKVVTASKDASAKVWDAKSGKLLLTLQGDQGSLSQARFSADGTKILTASWDKAARVWDAATGKQLLKLAGHQDQLVDAAFSPDGAKILTASADATAKIWDAKTGKELASLVGHELALRSARFSPDGLRVATASLDNAAAIWDAATGKQLHRISRHEGGVVAAEFGAAGRTLLTASEDNTAKIWDSARGAAPLTLAGHADWINAAGYDPKGARIVTASNDQTARVWDAASGKELFQIKDFIAPVIEARYSPDGLRILTACEYPNAEIWDAQTGAQLLSLTGHAKNLTDAQYSPDGKRIVTASADKLAKVWDAANGNLLFDLTQHTGAVNSARFSPNGELILTASSDQTAKTWDAASHTALRTFVGHAGPLSCAEFSADGKRIVTASWDKTARIWNPESAVAITTLVGHTAAVMDAQFSPDGSRVLTVSWDRTAKIWDAVTGRELSTVAGQPADIMSARYSPDGTTIVTASRDNTARVWDAILWEELRELVSAEAPFAERLRAWQEGRYAAWAKLAAGAGN